MGFSFDADTFEPIFVSSETGLSSWNNDGEDWTENTSGKGRGKSDTSETEDSDSFFDSEVNIILVMIGLSIFFGLLFCGVFRCFVEQKLRHSRAEDRHRSSQMYSPDQDPASAPMPYVVDGGNVYQVRKGDVVEMNGTDPLKKDGSPVVERGRPVVTGEEVTSQRPSRGQQQSERGGQRRSKQISGDSTSRRDVFDASGRRVGAGERKTGERMRSSSGNSSETKRVHPEERRSVNDILKAGGSRK